MQQITTKVKALIVGATMMLAAVPAVAATYDIDTSHSSVGFKIKHMAISNVKGSFNDFSGSFEFEPGQTDQWSCEATIKLASINTGNEDRDEHLLGEDFFDGEKYPHMVFQFTSIKMEDDEEGILTGTLAMHGKTLPVTLELEFNGSVTDPWGNQRVGFTAEGKINRKDWGLSYGKVMEGGGLMIGNEVKIALEIEGIKRP